jgi:hypothetical protein
MGDGRTEDSGGLTRSEENVIRLPRDWLGPPEELVPIGPAARARAAQRELEDGLPPAADAFWSEDAAALHDAVQAPPGATCQRLDPPVGLVPPVAGPRVPALSRLPRFVSFGRHGRLSRWWALLAVPVAALLVLAVIGAAEGPASHPHATRGSAFDPGLARVTATAQAVDRDAAAAKFKSQAKRQQHASVRERGSGRARAHTRARRARVAKTGHGVASHHSTGSSAPTVTEAAASPPTTHPSAPTSIGSEPSASTASTHSSGGSTSATGPAGPIGIGSISGGCTVKCS